MSHPTSPLGPFELIEPISAGGMGAVWKGRHTEQGVPVAIKVLLPPAVSRDIHAAALANEVRQAARLHHVGIAQVLDYGFATAEEATASRGAVAQNSPYLVMEFIDGRPLSLYPTPLSWYEVVPILIALLDALAHAHARGVVHRDIKPANLIIGSGLDQRTGLKLTDFGIAQAASVGAAIPVMARAGTPGFASPEQIMGEWRRQGPWTDLFSVGALAIYLLTGDAPAPAVPSSVLDTGVVERVQGVPVGLRPWLDLMLASHPRKRLKCAADALRLLETLVEGESLTPGMGGISRSLATFSFDAPEALLEASPVGDGEPLVKAFPETWRRVGDPEPPPRLIGAGVGLFEHRQAPRVGREAEHDMGWHELKRVVAEGRPRAIVVKGGTGVGKTRLAQGLAERAHELGLASILWASHAEGNEPGVALRRMVAQHLGCLGLERDVVAIVRTLKACPYGLDPEQVTALTHLLLDDGQHLVEIERRLVTLKGVLQHLGRKRPLILVLDDVQWGADSLAFANFILKAGATSPTPVLLVLCVREDELPIRPEEDKLLALVEAHVGAVTLQLSPMRSEEIAGLASRLLVLDDHLVRQLVERSDGVPLVAVELVRDWVQRGVLRMGDGGFKVPAGEHLVVPDSLHDLWRSGVDRFVEERGDDSLLALSAAAALGRFVQVSEWNATCASLGVAQPDLETLYRARLATPTESGWAFGHPLVRDCVERLAREADIWVRVNLACATMVGQHAAGAYSPARLARYLVAGGRPADAIGPAQVAVQRSVATSDFGEALDLIALLRQAMDGAGVAPEDEARGQLLADEVWALIGLTRLDQADQLSSLCLSRARTHRWRSLECRAWRLRGTLLEKRGQLADAELALEKGMSLAGRRRETLDQAICMEHLGSLLRMRGELDESLGYLEDAVELYEDLDSPRHQADCLKELGATLIMLGRSEEGTRRLVDARGLYARVGSAQGEAQCLNNLGEQYRHSGRIEEAETAYGEAFKVMEAAGYVAASIPLLNLGLLYDRQGRTTDAREVMERSLGMVRSAGMRTLEGLVLSCLLPSMARAGEWQKLDRTLALARTIIDESGMREPDIADCALRAADLARAAGHRARAADLEQLAAVHTPKGS